MHFLKLRVRVLKIYITASMWVLLVKGDFFKMIFENESLNLDR